MAMAVPPGYASPLWPPTGIALAALLMWGRKHWPGIWLGAIANQMLASHDFSGQLTDMMLLSSLIIAAGSTLQAFVASWLVEKWLQPGLPRLDSPHSIFIFFLLSAPIASVIASSIGVTTLVVLNVMPATSALFSWWNWWVGDSLGVLIIAPLLFCLYGKPRELWLTRCRSVALPLVASLLALIMIFIMVFRAEQSRMQLIFDSQAATIDRLLVKYADNIIDSALALRDLYSASSEVQRQEFTIFAQNLLHRHPEIQALEWLPRVTYAELPTFEQSLQNQGFTGFRVTEKGANESLQAVQKRAEYFPVIYIHPMAGNEKAFGFDSYTNSISRAAKEWARSTGKPSATPRMNLIQGNTTEHGILVSIPIYTTKQQLVTAQLSGFVSAVVLPHKIIDIAIQGFDTQLLGISLLDLSAPIAERTLFDKPVISRLGKNYQLNNWQHNFQFADRTWQIVVTPDSSFMIANGSTLPWVTLIGGLFFTSLLCCFLLIISGRTAQVEALIDSRTRELAKANNELDVSVQTARASELMLRTVIESQPESVQLISQDNRLQQINRAGLDMLEADSPEQVQALDLQTLIVAKYHAAVQQLIQRIFRGETGTLEFEMHGLKGTHRWLETHAVPLRDTQGAIVAMLSITRDITQRKHAEEHLKLAARVFNASHEGIFITDARALIIDVNPMFCEITGYSRGEVIGRKPSILRSGKQSTTFYTEMWSSLLSNHYWQGEMWNRKKNGDLFVERLTISALCDGEQAVSYYVGMFSDITQAKQQQQLLESMAHFDPLTQLPNRLLFADRLNQAIAHAKREKCLLAICFLDLDGFKPINDQYGHEAGDKILIAVADRIKTSIREEDSVSRHGGDEFALLLGDLESIEQCEQAIQRIHQAISSPYLIDGHYLTVGVSSGVTLYPLDNTDPDTLLRHADHAMYQAKLAGKNRHHLFDSSQDQQIIDRHKQLREIESAFLANQLCLYYQPKVNIKTGQVIGVEALIRWQHPTSGLIPPLEFLPIIASTELEIRIGNWVLEQAWQQLAAWHQEGLELEVSVNISSYHLLWPGLLQHLESILNVYPSINAKLLQLEILETTAVDDLNGVNLTVQSSRDLLGISIALDDFGTGYSSLTHLRHLSVDTVKIDRSFVRDMLDDPDDYAIVESVISLSQAFHRSVIAEGVENQEQGIVLLLMGCHLLQGYTIARPMPAEAIAAWVRQYQPYAEWQLYASAQLTPEQAVMAILKIDVRQWFLRVKACLYATQQECSWPIMASGKCLFGRWLKQTKPDRYYSLAWLERAERLHQQFHQHANGLRGLVLDKEFAKAQAGCEELDRMQQQILAQLSEFD